jgi:hypothetical protein
LQVTLGGIKTYVPEIRRCRRLLMIGEDRTLGLLNMIENKMGIRVYVTSKDRIN